MNELDEKLGVIMENTNRMSQILEAMLHLQRIAQLEDGHIYEFLHMDRHVRMSLPLAQRDYIQKEIIRKGKFYESRLLDHLRDSTDIKKGSIIYDVGANIGNHSVYFGLFFGPSLLVSIEPQQTASQTLRTNLEFNKLNNARIVNCLLGSMEGTGSISHFGQNNTGGTTFREDPRGEVPMRKLDSVIKEQSDGKVDFLKMDVEGMHVQVLSGAVKTLEEARPKIWIELRAHKGEYESGSKFLAKYGYKQSMKLGAHDYVFDPE
ncbi:FkbM family methyltransferase [uncultured Aliiroseovarius sp.]|uniref:FkbM family methyltransferase n=1 Tax=uncultured Aliiroseovarius sp. TaxID=1658783 RepID=UPI00263163F3|nr:FkbM family methyltransferase [uncultured Aliiroseovarius sp.]